MDFDALDLSILKTILNNRKYALDFINQCNEKVFMPDTWRFSKFIIDYIKTYKEVPTQRVLIEKMGAKNPALIDHVNVFFTKLNNFKYDEREYKHDLEKIKNRFSQTLINGLKDNLAEAQIDLKKNINDIQFTLNNIKSVNQLKVYKDGSLRDYANDFIDLYNAKRENPEFGVGIRTGYTFIDYAIGGLKPGELLLYAGITSSGKSLLLMNTAIQMWLGENNIEMTEHFKKGCDVLLFSLEMNYEDYMQRVLARLAMVPQRSIREASLTEDEQKRVSKAFRFIKSYPHSFKVIDLPRRATAETLELIINEQTDKGDKPSVVVVDYMNLMTADVGKDQSDWLIQSAISEQCHELARVKEIILLSAVQLNPKGGDGKETSAGVKSFRRATQIADNADFIIGINTRKDEKQYPDFSCSFLKNRKGELTDGKLHKEMACCALLDKEITPGSDIEDISNLMSQFQ